MKRISINQFKLLIAAMWIATGLAVFGVVQYERSCSFERKVAQLEDSLSCMSLGLSKLESETKLLKASIAAVDDLRHPATPPITNSVVYYANRRWRNSELMKYKTAYDSAEAKIGPAVREYEMSVANLNQVQQ